MKWSHLSGWALILSALIFLFGFAWDHLLNGPYTLFTVMLGIVGNILFLVGLPAIQRSQPQTGRPGHVGLILMALGAVIAIFANLLIRLAGVEVEDWVPLTSAISGCIGSLIVGWLTVRAKVFRPWIGWLMIVGAILNILFPVLPPQAVFISQIGLFAQSAALIGYGLTMLQRERLASSSSISGYSHSHGRKGPIVFRFLEFAQQTTEAEKSSTGGDPNNVMIFCESGVGAKTSCLFAMPEAAPDFNKASIERGPGVRMNTVEQAAQTTTWVLKELNITPKDWRKLLEVLAAELLRVQFSLPLR